MNILELIMNSLITLDYKFKYKNFWHGLTALTGGRSCGLVRVKSRFHKAFEIECKLLSEG